MPLNETERLMFGDLGSSVAVRLSDIMDVDAEPLRAVMTKLHQKELDALAAEDREVALDVIISACQRRWATMQRRTETSRKR